jgi:hypothetical protein
MNVMFRAETKLKIEQEYQRGLDARKQGFEGRARVCARRAAGAAAREYYFLRGAPVLSTSAYDLLRQLEADPDIGIRAREAAGRLLERVETDFTLPTNIDLLQDARNLIDELEALCDQQ